MESMVLIPLIIVLAIVVLAIFLHFVPMGLWITALVGVGTAELGADEAVGDDVDATDEDERAHD